MWEDSGAKEAEGRLHPPPGLCDTHRACARGGVACLSLFGPPSPPDTSRRPKDSEREGQGYSFVSRAEMEADIRAGRYLEHGEYEGNLYGTRIDSIRGVVAAGKVCVLDVNPQVPPSRLSTLPSIPSGRSASPSCPSYISRHLSLKHSHITYQLLLGTQPTWTPFLSLLDPHSSNLLQLSQSLATCQLFFYHASLGLMSQNPRYPFLIHS